METDCLLVNTSFESLKCLKQNYLFFPIKATCLCTLSQFAMSIVPCWKRISAALCVNNLSAAVAETFQSKQNQAAHYSLLGLSVTSKDLPAVSKPLGSKLLGLGERQVCLEHARKSMDKWKRESTRLCICTPLQTFLCVCVYLGGCMCVRVFFSWGCALILGHYYVALGENSITLSVCEAACHQVFHAKSIMDWRRTFIICTGGSVGPFPQHRCLLCTFVGVCTYGS